MARERRFSRRYETFDDWDRHSGNSSFTNRIRRKHAQYPDRSLSALRISSLTGIPLSKRNYNALTPIERQTRVKALSVLRLMRSGQSLLTALNAAGIDRKKATRHLGDALEKDKKGNIRAAATDAITRELVIYTNGLKKTIVVGGSGQASTVGRYHNAVGRYLDGDRSALKPFKGAKIKDENNVSYELETEPEKIELIKESEEEREVFDIYSGGE